MGPLPGEELQAYLVLLHFADCPLRLLCFSQNEGLWQPCPEQAWLVPFF